VSLIEQKYKYNQVIVSIVGYGDNLKIRVVQLKTLRMSGVEDEDDKGMIISELGQINDTKLEESIRRSKRKIYEYAICNPWDFFFTGTLDKEKYDRSDLEKYHKDLTQFFRDYKKKYGVYIEFLLIPELHKDRKSWHIHGFIHGLPSEHLIQFKKGDKIPKAIAEKVKNCETVYKWIDYQKKFGWNSLEPIKSHEAVSKYITKYINKDLAKSVTELNAHLYYHSRGLNVAKKISQGTIIDGITYTGLYMKDKKIKMDTYSNEYCSIVTVDYNEETLNNILEQIY